MKKINFVLVILGCLLIRCTEDIIDKSTEGDPHGTIYGSWKLTSVVNLSDESKYLDVVLELHDNSTYKLTDNDGSEVVSSSFERKASNITFKNGLFEDYKVTMQVIKLSSDELWLKEHYTLDNKDTYIEYHWTKN